MGWENGRKDCGYYNTENGKLKKSVGNKHVETIKNICNAL